MAEKIAAAPPMTVGTARRVLATWPCPSCSASWTTR